MKVLMDSDVIIECLRGNERALGQVGSLHKTGHLLACTVVSIAEIHAGIRPGEEQRITSFFAHLAVMDLTPQVGIKAGEYLRKYSGSHHVEIADALIAACAVLNKARLYTLNRKHYPMGDLSFL